MAMYKEEMLCEEAILCASSVYTKQFYLNPQFASLPEEVKEELKIISVLFTEDVGGMLIMEFDADGHLQLQTSADENDLLYDEIGAVLKLKQLQRTKTELLESLELYYRLFFLELDDE